MSVIIPSVQAAAAAPRRFLYPSTWLVLIADLLPVAGILFWGWDGFVLLMLYWMETAVIAFWALARILTLPGDPREPPQNFILHVGGRLFLTGFFLVHSSGFMAGHLLFLWTLYAGHWRDTIHSPQEFWREIVLGYELWIPLGLLFVARGGAFVWDLYRQLRGMNQRPVNDDGMDKIIGGLYGRIILMHIVVIFGVWVAMKIGSTGPYLLLIALKTIFDLYMHVSVDLGRKQKSANA